VATRCTAPVSLPYFLPIKTGGEEKKGREKREAKRTQEKGDRDKRAEKVGETESEKKTKGERRRIEEKNRKQREIGKTGEELVKTVIAGTVSATASHRR